MEIRKAARKYRPLKIGIGGLPGSGKTLGSLKMAYGICGDWEKICIIDTENKSADLYAHLGPYSVLPIESHSPKTYCEAIKKIIEAKLFDVMILDSISHEWAGRGGVLEIVDNIANSSTSGNTYTAWNKGTPIHNEFVDAWIQAPIHTIATMRAKDDYVLQANEKNKITPKKVGLKNIQRDGIDYEFDIVFRIEASHKAHAEKDRTSLFDVEEYFYLDEKIGGRLNDWSHNTSCLNEIYNSSNAGCKIILKSIIDEFKITDVNAMKQISSQCDGKSFAECKEIIKEIKP